MNKKLIFITYLSILLKAANAFTFTHDNEVCFYNATIESFVMTGHSISESQPFEENITINNQKNNGCLDIRAGRKNESQNVAWIKQNMEMENIPWDTNHMKATSSSKPGETIPAALHFAVKGTLLVNMSNITYICPYVQLGQGEFGLGQNWWVFTNNKDPNPDTKWSLKCQIKDSTTVVSIYVYNYSQYDNHAFWLSFDAPVNK